MSHAAARYLVAAVVAATAALEVAALGLAAGVVPLGQPVLYAAYAGIQVVAGAIIVWNYPRHPIGWLLAAFALNQALLADAALAYGQHGYAEGWPGATHAEVVSLTSWPVGALGDQPAVPAVPRRAIPLPRLALGAGPCGSWARRWRIPGWALNPRLGADLSRRRQPAGHRRVPGSSRRSPSGATLVCACARGVRGRAAAALPPLARVRERQQLKWVLLAGGVLALVLPAVRRAVDRLAPDPLRPALALPLLPIAVCVAIVRHHLYDIDLVISRTVAYGALTGVLAGALRRPSCSPSGALVASPVAAAAGALVVAVAFWPVRTRIQDAGRPAVPPGAVRVAAGDDRLRRPAPARRGGRRRRRGRAAHGRPRR